MNGREFLMDVGLSTADDPVFSIAEGVLSRVQS
jgi:hypothetical protein